MFEPSRSNRKIIQINCGTGIPQKVYFHFARYLSKQGFTVITFDYHRIGASKPRKLRGFKTKPQGWEQIDMVSVLDWINEKYPDFGK
ncbi:MAG: hypothetical protein ACFB0B_07740 [Thermonemataceae bacterium]